MIARDGLRMRLHVIHNKQRFHLLLDKLGFATEQPITNNDDLSTIAFRMENRAHRPHATHMRISGNVFCALRVAVN